MVNLTDNARKEIFRSESSITELSTIYGVSRTTIWNIKNPRKCYANRKKRKEDYHSKDYYNKDLYRLYKAITKLRQQVTKGEISRKEHRKNMDKLLRGPLVLQVKYSKEG